jgi:GAF domain-containing protein
MVLAEYDFQPGRPILQLPKLTQAQHEADEEDLYAGLIGLAGIVVGALSVEELLTQVAEFAARAIPGVDGASATVAHPSWARSRIQVWAVTTKLVAEIDTLQYEVYTEGPCITSMRTRRPCISGSIGEDARWPRFGAAASRLGVNSVMSLPLMLGEEMIGAIDAYAYNPDTFAEHAVAMGARFAGPTAVSIHNAQMLIEARYQAEQLRRALVSRSVIDQAIGIVRSRSGGSAAEALDRLVQISQSENVKLQVIAERLVDISVRRAHDRHGLP